MANWQRAGDIPGLLAAGSGPPVVPRPGGALVGGGGHDGQPLSMDFGIWDFTWRTLVLWIGLLLVIPVPWVIAMYWRWIASRVQVPQHRDLVFTGRTMTLVIWYFAAIIIAIGISPLGSRLLNLVMIVGQMFLYWLLVRWFVANLSEAGQPLGLTFSGSFWGYLGWNILGALSVITIIGWAWVYTAQIRWMCRHIEGTRRAIVFNATGLEFLWRGVVTMIGCFFIIPIPWVMRWFIRWQVSQIVLVERSATASA
jgi:hypothetical protein